MRVLITGIAGFIGFHTARALLEDGWQVVGIDNLNDNIGDRQLKLDRLGQLGVETDLGKFESTYSALEFRLVDISIKDEVYHIFSEHDFATVIHFAAQAGVRHSLEDPDAYVQSNLVGFANIMDACREFGIMHLIYASSSSVYGNTDIVPFEEDRVDFRPVSLYAATKLSNEHMAYAYSHIYGIRTTGLRFFTVYGPWGRKDMAYSIFTEKILSNKTVKVFNHGDQYRDFTYIDDVVSLFPKIISKNDWVDPDELPANIFNIGSSRPVKLMDFITILEDIIGVAAKKDLVERLTVDVDRTYADTQKARDAFGFDPGHDLETGLRNFISWYKSYAIRDESYSYQMKSE